MTGIIDYGCGNLFSLVSSLKKLGARAEVITDKKDLERCKRLILPGVGAFGKAAQKLKNSGMSETVVKLSESGVPLFGICLGMQMLFERSFEYGEHDGLALLNGEVRPLEGDISGLKIPHMGWNSLDIKDKSGIFRYVDSGEYVYFVHSYYAKTSAKNLLATTFYGTEICAAAGRDNVFGTQFHPEKSGDVGLRILKAFLEL